MHVLEHKRKKYSLTNDGTLELFFLGTGTAFSHRLGHTNFLIVKGEDHLLVDFGTAGPERLRSVAGLDPNDIRIFLPTHAHADHIGGMEYLTVWNRYVRRNTDPANPRLKVVVTEEFARELWRMTLRGGLGFNETGMDGRDELFGTYYEVIHPEALPDTERETWSVQVGSIRLELFRTRHVLGSAADDGMGFRSHGLFIDDRIFFSGDSAFDPELIGLYSNRAEFWIHDAGIYTPPLHASLEELRSLPEEIRRNMLLVHYPEGAEEIPVPDFRGWVDFGLRYIFD